LLKQALNIPEQIKTHSSPGENINYSNQQNANLNHNENNSSEMTNLLDLFKSTNKSDQLSTREGNQ